MPSALALRFLTAGVDLVPNVNQWYPVAIITNGYLNSVSAYVQTTGENLEVRITLDGVVWGPSAQACVAGTVYHISMSRLGNVLFLAFNVAGGVEASVDMFTGVHCLNGFVEVRKVTANGAGNLRARAIWGSVA